MAGAVSIRAGKIHRSTEEGRLISWLDNIKREGEQWRSKALTDSDKYERIYSGIRRLASDVTPPRFRAAVAGPTIRRRDALLTEQQPVFRVEPLIANVDDVADELTQLSEFAWQDHGFPGAIEDMVEMGSVFGSSGLSLPFNFDLSGGLGSCEPIVRDPRGVLIDPNVVRSADVQTRAKYVMIESVEAIWDMQRAFPGRGKDIKPEVGLSGTIRSPLSKRSIMGDSQGQVSYRDRIKRLQDGPIPRCLKEVYFIRDPQLNSNNTPMFPLGRMIVRAGDIILEDTDAPFNDGEPDLVWYQNRRNFDNAWGHSEVEALRYLQGAINRIGEMFVNNTVLMGNSRVIMDNDAIGNDSMNNLTNAEALIISKKRMSTITWDPPPAMPPHFLQFIQFALRLVDYLIGLNDGQLEGRGRIEMRSGTQLEGLQNAAQVLIRAMARRLEEWMERFGRKFISRIFQFYTQDRILLATGPGGQWLKYSFQRDKLLKNYYEVARSAADRANVQDGEERDKFLDGKIKELIDDAALQFAFRVQPLSSLATQKAARAQLLLQLVEGVMLPRRIILHEVGYTDAVAKQYIDEATQEHQAMAASGIQPQPKKKPGGKK